MSKSFRIFSQWRKRDGWCFVPFSIWANEDFYGLVVLNFCFECSRSDFGRRIHDLMRAS